MNNKSYKPNKIKQSDALPDVGRIMEKLSETSFLTDSSTQNIG